MSVNEPCNKYRQVVALITNYSEEELHRRCQACMVKVIFKCSPSVPRCPIWDAGHGTPGAQVLHIVTYVSRGVPDVLINRRLSLRGA